MVQVISSVLLLAVAGLVAAVPRSHVLEARDADCRDDIQGGQTAIGPVVNCINELASRAGQQCQATISANALCSSTGLTVSGQSSRKVNGVFTDAFADCNDVARGLGQILDRCARGDGTVKGDNTAFGNGDFIVHIRGGV